MPNLIREGDRGRPWRRAATILATAATVGVAALGLIASVRASDSIEIVIRHSHFEPSSIRVPSGVPVTITIRNEDPIDHEWIAGDAAVHDRHRAGTDGFHALIPTEVTIPALETRTTVVTFPAASGWTYVCHLPGHEAFGMVGTIAIDGT